jgi:hypothetical protein
MRMRAFAAAIAGCLIVAASWLGAGAASATVSANATTYEGTSGTVTVCGNCVTTVSVSTWATAYNAPLPISVIAGNGCDNYSVYNRYAGASGSLWYAKSDIAKDDSFSCAAQWQFGIVNGS